MTTTTEGGKSGEIAIPTGYSRSNGTGMLVEQNGGWVPLSDFINGLQDCITSLEKELREAKRKLCDTEELVRLGDADIQRLEAVVRSGEYVARDLVAAAHRAEAAEEAVKTLYRVCNELEIIMLYCPENGGEPSCTQCHIIGVGSHSNQCEVGKQMRLASSALTAAKAKETKP